MLSHLKNIVAGFGESSGNMTVPLATAEWIVENLSVEVSPVNEGPDCRVFSVALPALRDAFSLIEEGTDAPATPAVTSENRPVDQSTGKDTTKEETTPVVPVPPRQKKKK